MTDDPIHLFVPTFRVDECLAEIRECLEKGWTGIGFKTIEFEEAWKDYTGLPHAHFLELGDRRPAPGLPAAQGAGRLGATGDEVITTPLTFVSTNHAILYENLRPVFADVDEYLCLDPQSVAERITDRDPRHHLRRPGRQHRPARRDRRALPRARAAS